jgi:hypothetical protein
LSARRLAAFLVGSLGLVASAGAQNIERAEAESSDVVRSEEVAPEGVSSAADSLAEPSVPSTPDSLESAEVMAPTEGSASPDSLGETPEPVEAKAEPPFRTNPTWTALASFRLERSSGVDRIRLGSASDPLVPVGNSSLADLLRIRSGVRTRELSPGPTVQTFELRGGGSDRGELVYGGGSLRVPGSAGPHTHEVVLSELSSFTLVRSGASALFGPDALTGAVWLEPRFPAYDELRSRASGEEGVDDYQRGAFEIGSPFGSRGAWFLSAESRRIDGFFPGTKEVDRHVTGVVRGSLWGPVFGGLHIRRYEGDGRAGAFDEPIVSVLTKRTSAELELFSPWGESRGTLLHMELLSERLEKVGDATPKTREFDSPALRVTSDLPDVGSLETVARLEASRWRIETKETSERDEFWRGALALRTTQNFAQGLITGTFRLDGEEERRRALQARVEGELNWSAATIFAAAARGERPPVRGAVGKAERHISAEVGARVERGFFRVGTTFFGVRISERRPDPTFGEVRLREAPRAGAAGDAEIVGATFDFGCSSVRIPRVGFLGKLTIDTNYTILSAEDEAGTKLPGRPSRAWTGEGFLERRFFDDDLLARVRGRLTHYGDRSADLESAPRDAWLTDVILEGEIGDAVFFYRFHDLLERGDEVEPGYPFPGFSRTYGITWSFRR